MPDIVITEFMDAPSVARLAERFDTVYDPGLAERAERIPRLLARARALVVRNRTSVTDELLAEAPRLRIVGRLGVNLDNIDLAAAEARGVTVVPAVGTGDDSVAEYVVAMVLHLLRGAFAATGEVAGGAWPRTRLIGREASGKTLGLVGYGAVARKTAARARALGMTIAAFDPFVPAGDPAWGDATRAETLPALLAAADAVSLHVPLTEATRHLVDAAALSAMRPDAVLINAARGGVVDEAALAGALRAGAIAGAALDVFEVEPLPRSAGAVFADCPNLVLTPHIAGVTEESNARIGAMIADAVISSLEGNA
ncbi:MAG: NAD(P)-dependent oxidoreductase [Thalassobaculum sp.]|uniref:NAD(P)-dependent oxidoreductase n=1 Tax=Thalassobaculum sp. TaxID=2022740 RepID=UPI0032EC80F6